MLGTKKLRLNGTGYKPLSEPEIAVFLAGGKAPIALAVMLALYTGQRLGDIVVMKREHYRGGEIKVRRHKTSELLPLVCPDSLQRCSIRGFSPDAPNLLVNEKGNPYPNEGAFSNAPKREVCRLKLGEKTSFHGLRYAAAVRLEEAGDPLSMIQAVLGHRIYQMASQYASKRRGAADAARLFNDSSRERN